VVAQAGIRAGDVFIVMVNSERATLDTPLADGDRLALFPPISGG
jgi:molybdopterin synthase sulfur carrier subunit